MRTIFYIIVLLLYASLSFAQVTQEWVKRYSGPGWLGAIASAIVVDASGNIYVTGSSHGGQSTHVDYTTIKYNSDGEELWEARYSNPNSFSASAVDLAVDNFGNVFVTGSISNGDNYDFCTVKYNSEGIEQWVRVYNGPGDGHEYAVALTIDAEANVYITGYSNGIGGVGTQSDYATIKYNTNGDQLWVARYDGPIGVNGNIGDQPTSIVIDNNGNIYVTGFSEDDASTFSLSYATVKYSSNGIEQWVSRYKHSSESFVNKASSITIDNESNIYVTGSSDDLNTEVDFATIKYNSDGLELWVQRYTGPYSGSHAEAVSVKTDESGNVYVSGTATTQSGYEVFAIVKYNSSGQEQWMALYDAQNSQGNFVSSMAVDGAGNIYVTGVTVSSSFNIDYLTVKYNSAGIPKWEILYDGTGLGEDQVTDIAINLSGDVFITGYSFEQGSSFYEYATIKYSQSVPSTTLTANVSAGSQVLEVVSTNGFSIGDNIVINPGGSTEETNTITGFGSMLLQTPLQFDHNAGEVVLLLSSTSVEGNPEFTANEYFISQNYPNPFNPTTKIKFLIVESGNVSLKIYDILGNEIANLVNEELSSGTYEVTFDASHFASGMYLYRIQAGSFVETKKMLLLK